MIKIEVYADGLAFIEGKTIDGKPLAQSHFSVASAIEVATQHAYKQEGKGLYKVQGVCLWFEPGCPDTTPVEFPEYIGPDDTDDSDN